MQRNFAIGGGPAASTSSSQRQQQQQRSAQLHSLSALPRVASEDSWVEIASQPSSSSLSSVAEDNIDTGLRVQHEVGGPERRRRRNRRWTAETLQMAPRTLVADGNASQEDYDESESESDHIMSSSTEDFRPSPIIENWRPPAISANARHGMSSASSENAYASDENEDDDDDEATAIGDRRPTVNSFVPQPNAFTISQQSSSAGIRSQQIPIDHRRSRPAASHRHSFPQHSPYNVMAPNYRVDHDAALRASLTTLLSCAAAARGLPKSGRSTNSHQVPSSRVDATTLRIVPESALLGSDIASADATRSSDPDSASDKGKRKAASSSATTTSNTTRSSSKDRRAWKKARLNSTPLLDDVSPTLMTWVVSAGVVVLVSAISFSAGYVYGKEIGHAEASGLIADGRCGKDVLMESGKRLKWTTSAGIRA